jgi:SAM-dependent methyltransferase
VRRRAEATPAPPRARYLTATEPPRPVSLKTGSLQPSNPDVQLIPAESGNIAEGRFGATRILSLSLGDRDTLPRLRQGGTSDARGVPEPGPGGREGAGVTGAVADGDWVSLRGVLLDQASEPYRQAGRFAYHFARGKLRGDPVFRAILELGLLRGYPRILDLGCGQGLLAAWLRAAAHCYERGTWPRDWPPAPCPQSMRGIELRAREVERARRALGPGCEVVQADIRSAVFGSADAVVILDVLHYLPAPSQREVLQRVRAALPRGGLLLLRVGDADAGLRFHFTRWVDQVVMLARGQGLVDLHCRSIEQWRQLLRDCGFDTRAEPMSHGTPFANVLLIALAI